MDVMFLSKLFSMMIIATILIGVGVLFTISIPDKAHAHDAHVISFDAHQHSSVDQSNPPSKHEHPKNQDHHQGNCCHSFACAGGAVFFVNDALLLNAAGGRIPLLPVTFVQGQPIPPSEHPPKLIA
jgi:hypothetical protein